MSPELSQKLTQAVERMPAFPKSVQRILELTRDVNCTPKDLVDVIDKDPVVTVKILKVVNSAYFSLPKQITSVGHAVVYLGFNSIKNMALGIAAIGMLPEKNDSGFDVQQYLLHSLATAAIAKHIAAKVADDADPNDCFIAGLLHDFGKVVFAQFMPQEFGRALALSRTHNSSLHLALQETIGVDHAVVGAMLARKWRFPEHLVEAIEYQHGGDTQHNSELIACVFAANQISKKLSFGFGGNPHVAPFPPTVQKRLGGDMDALLGRLGDLQPLFQEAQVFARL